MAGQGVQGQLLDINILGCRNLRDKEWLSRQDPYVVIHYASSKFRTKTDTDGSRNPSFNQKFVLPLIEGLREVNVEVWNSNTLQFDDFIGSGRIMLEKALTVGYDDSTWNLTSKSGKFAGEVRVILHFIKTEKLKPMIAPAYQTAAPAYQTPGYSPTPPQAYQAPGYNPSPPQAYPYGPPNPYPYQPTPPSSAYYNPQQQAAPYPAYPPSGPYASQPQYPPPPAPGYGGSYPPTPPAAPSAGYPPVYQEYPYRPY